MKLTKAQLCALTAVAEHAPYEPSRDALLASGVNMTSVWAVDRRGLITWTRYADGVHFRLTAAGRAALESQQ